MSDRRTARTEVGTWITTLSLAVVLEDGFTNESPVRSPEVRLEGIDVEPVTTPSGYQVFLDLPADPVTVVVDGRNPFLDERREAVDVIDLSDPNADVDPADPESLPVETVVLRPAPSYRFPSGATVVRGVVRTASDEPVSDATVSIAGNSPTVDVSHPAHGTLFEPISLTEGDLATTKLRYS